ncbi:MAG: 2-hydroxyacyl-CoA dehydratase family protein [Oscillospiraceae bacterium]|nr:2-hydroxyacyl-CoA dehydratase family protein [Oscillospiraceae bacterium]
MADLSTMIAGLKAISPKEELKKAVSAGKKVIGIMPYFCPEELVYASGMVPLGLWGADMQANESKRYYPAFICSILHTVLEMGIKGKLNDLSGIMIPASCDSLKSMGANWQYGVKTVPVINVSIAQNRKIPAGKEYTASQFKKVRDELSKISGKEITDEAIIDAIKVYNENRKALREFSFLAGKHPEAISPADRNAVIKAGYFMDRKEHTKAVLAISAELASLPESSFRGAKVVTSGILADSPSLLKIFEDLHIAVVDDQIAHESLNFRTDVPIIESDPIMGMAERIAEIEGCSVLFDPGKKRGQELVKLAQDAGADGIIWIMTKFCDPEEYDYVPVKRMIDKAGIPLLAVEVDRQMVNYEQARNAIEAFSETLC